MGFALAFIYSNTRDPYIIQRVKLIFKWQTALTN